MASPVSASGSRSWLMNTVALLGPLDSKVMLSRVLRMSQVRRIVNDRLIGRVRRRSVGSVGRVTGRTSERDRSSADETARVALTAAAIAMGAGVFGAIQPEINSELGSRLGSSLVAAFINFGVAFLVALLVLSRRPSTRRTSLACRRGRCRGGPSPPASAA